MATKIDLLFILSNPRRRQILKKISEANFAIDPEGKNCRYGILETSLDMSHGGLWKHIKILKKAGLVKVFGYLPQGYKMKRGRPPLRLIIPTITDECKEKIIKELEEIKKLLQETNKRSKKIKKFFKKKKTH